MSWWRSLRHSGRATRPKRYSAAGARCWWICGARKYVISCVSASTTRAGSPLSRHSRRPVSTCCAPAISSGRTRVWSHSPCFIGSTTIANTVCAKVCMYRHGLGDCFLVTLPRQDGSNYFIMIDCGVVLGTSDANSRMAAVVADIAATTGGHVDLLAATHGHWDHISGFVQAADAFKNLSFGQVWLAWTEDPTDALAKALGQERDNALKGLRLSANHLRLAGDDGRAEMVGSLLEFFGATGGASTSDALEAIRQKVPTPRYCHPLDPPVKLTDPAARLYVLGPPHDETQIRMALPTARNPGTSTYTMALDVFLNDVASALGNVAPDSPFGGQFRIPLPAARAMDFFNRRYWSTDTWRQIDGAWLEGSPQLALQLDSAT